MTIEFLDARRLTGPSLLFDAPGSILDVHCTEAEAKRLAPLWQRAVREMLAALDWPFEPRFASLTMSGGISLAFTAPLDALYAASELNEWAFAACAAEMNGSEAPSFAETVAALQQALNEEANPDLLALASWAIEQGVPFLWDDDEASVGLGRHSSTWPVRALPDPGTLEASDYRQIPIALVTGTNGKTTSVRLAAHILTAAGINAGFSSTDYIAIGERVIDRDDWAGPGGARKVLRYADVDAAILETARGGLLRRGLGVPKADAALITNIAKDHLGDFGSRNLDELLQVKWIVSRAVEDSGTLVLNADDARLVAQAQNYTGRIIWFSLDADNPHVLAHVHGGGVAFVLAGTALTLLGDKEPEILIDVADVPITVGGAARHNIANALAAAALTGSLGISLEDIRAGLTSMSQHENPGRGNIYSVAGRTIIVDFAHNPQAMQALLEMAGRLPARRRGLCFGQAGDRPDELIRELTRSAWGRGLDRVYVSELAKYYRGREPGAVFAVIRDELLRAGSRPEQIEHHEQEIDSLEAALAWAEPGDQIVMLALERSQALYEKLERLQSAG